MNKNENIIIAEYSDIAVAELAIDQLREWDKRVNDVKLGVIGLAYYENGLVVSRVVHGSLFHRAFPLSDEGLKALGAELQEGRAAVVVKADDYEVSMVTDGLTRSGGRILVASYERSAEEEEAERKAAEATLPEAGDRDIKSPRLDAASRINRPH